MRVSVIGTGYVGLVSGVCLAEQGHEVICVDVDAAKVAKISAGVPPIFEEGLEGLLRKHAGKRLRATLDLRAAVLGSDLTLIAVGTPFDGSRIDLAYVKQAAAQIGAALRDKPDYHVVVVKSTVVPGTTDGVVRRSLEEASGKRAGEHFGLGMNPEFLTEGQAIADFMHPDRIVLGGLDARSLEALEALYASFPAVPKIRTNPRTAEMIKYASNALLATAISFSNELANLCAAISGIDAVDVMEGLHASAYLTAIAPDGRRTKAPITSFLLPGCGFGGSCLPKDVKALITHGADHGAAMSLLRAVIAVNETQRTEVVRILERNFPRLDGLRVAVLGLAFKPDTDDVRESPAFPIIRALLSRNTVVRAWDPVAIPEAKKVLGETVAYARSLRDCVEHADAVVLVTRWKEFDALPALLNESRSPPLLVDGRRQFDRGSVARYTGIGV